MINSVTNSIIKQIHHQIESNMIILEYIIKEIHFHLKRINNILILNSIKECKINEDLQYNQLFVQEVSKIFNL